MRELNPEEWAQRVDEQARKYLGMSGEEFERRLRAGEIDIDDSVIAGRKLAGRALVEVGEMSTVLSTRNSST